MLRRLTNVLTVQPEPWRYSVGIQQHEQRMPTTTNTGQKGDIDAQRAKVPSNNFKATISRTTFAVFALPRKTHTPCPCCSSNKIPLPRPSLPGTSPPIGLQQGHRAADDQGNAFSTHRGQEQPTRRSFSWRASQSPRGGPLHPAR